MANETISEQILLLALHDERGSKLVEYTETATAAAALAELVLLGALVPSAEIKGRCELGSQRPPVDDAFLSSVMQVIEKKGLSKKVKTLISAIADKKEFLNHFMIA